MVIVLVDFGYSDWFKCRDMRPFGPFESTQEAEDWAELQQRYKETGREGEPLRFHVLPMHAPVEGAVQV